MPKIGVIKKKTPDKIWGFRRAIDGARTRGLDLGKVARYQLRHYRIKSVIVTTDLVILLQAITFVNNYFLRYFSPFYHHFTRSLMTSPAIISPTTEGTKAVEPGISLLSVHFLTVPGGHTQCCLQLMDISSCGLIAFSRE